MRVDMFLVVFNLRAIGASYLHDISSTELIEVHVNGRHLDATFRLVRYALASR